MDLTADHQAIGDAEGTRRYVRTWERIARHLATVAAEEEASGRMDPAEAEGLVRGVVALTLTMRALAQKYRFAGSARESGRLTVDRVASGFPVAAELMEMAADATQAAAHLAGMPSVERLKDDMVRHILSERTAPARLQFALAQRLYYEELAKGGLYFARNDPEAVWLGTVGEGAGQRLRYLLRWSVFEAADNIPVLYLLTVEDSGREALPKDPLRWPLVQRHLVAQSVGGLTLLTIARGFDADFPDLHPKRLRRVRLGPLHLRGFAGEGGPLGAVLEAARAPEGEDWALEWTEEDLASERSEAGAGGWFGTGPTREVFALAEPRERGWTAMARRLVVPQRVYQALAETDPPALRGVRKVVVGEGGRLLDLP